MLKTESNTAAMEKRVLAAARKRFGTRQMSAVFEHGQWWVEDRRNGAQYSVCDAEGYISVDGFCFEQVTVGDERS